MNTKTNKIITWIAVVTAVILLGVTIASILTQGFRNMRSETMIEAELNHNGNLILEPQDGKAMQMSVFRVALNGNTESIALTATLAPVTVENKNILWSVKWKDATASSWGKDKTVTDYVSLGAESALTGESVILTCKKDFGEQIIVTATAESNPEIAASCTIDYCQKIKSISYRFKYGDETIISPVADDNGVYKVDYTGEEKNYTVECTPEYTNYTVADNFTKSVCGNFSKEFGYTNASPFTDLSLQAGLFGSFTEPTISENATSFVNAVDKMCNPGNWQAGAPMANHADALYSALTPADKLHSKVINRKSALEKFVGNCGSAAAYYAAQTEANNVISGYVAPSPSGSFNGGVNIETENALLTAAKACNDAKVGIQHYTITFTGEHSIAEFTFDFGYTESSVQAARSMSMSLPSVMF